MRRAGRVTRIWRDENCIKYVGWKSEWKSHLKELGADDGIILKCISGKYVGRLWTRIKWLVIGTSGRV
jgi:hypothetical protein